MSSQSTTVLKVFNTVKTLKKIPENEYESEQCLDYFKKIDSSYNEDKSARMDIAKAIVESGFPEIALKCLKFYTRTSFFENEQTWPCSFYLLRSIWNFSDVYSEVALASTGFIPILLDLLSNEYLLPSDEEDEKLFKLALNILNNIAHQPETKVVFQQFQASKILKKLSNIENEHLKVLVYLILAQIVSENEFDKLNDPSNDVIESLTSFIKESLKKDRRYKGISTTEYMDCMSRMAVTKENKSKIIESGLVSVFKSLLNGANFTEEQNKTLTCIWNLCFDEKICETLRKEKELLGMISNIKNTSPSEELQRRSAGILFTMNDLLKKNVSKSSNGADSPNRRSLDSSMSTHLDKTKSHIMISYNCGSRDICLKIKDELKAKGYQVWIDIEQIYGSSLESMASAVENASVFLMCVSEKYYLSPNCRLEAEYAVRLQKPIVPLIIQPDYMPLGWLGIIIGGKIYYNFSGAKQSFDQTFLNMSKEINRHVAEEASNNNNTKAGKARQNNSSGNKNISNNDNSRNSSSSLGTLSTPEPNGTKNSISHKQTMEWTNRDFKIWITSLGISSWIADSDVFENLNGLMLRELHEMKKNAPDFFYNLIKSKFSNKPKNATGSSTNSENFSLHDLLKFSIEIDELFKPK